MSKMKKYYNLYDILPKSFIKCLDETMYKAILDINYESVNIISEEVELYIEKVYTICNKFIIENNKSNLKNLTKLQTFLTEILEYFAERIIISEKNLIGLQGCILLVESYRRELDFFNILKGMNFYKDISYRNTVESISDYYSNLVETELFSRDYKDSYEVI